MPAPDAFPELWDVCEDFAASLDAFLFPHHTHRHAHGKLASKLRARSNSSRLESQPDPDPVLELKSLAVRRLTSADSDPVLVGPAYSITGVRSCEGTGRNKAIRQQPFASCVFTGSAAEDRMAGYSHATMLRPTNSILRKAHAHWSSQGRGKRFKAVSWHPEIIGAAPINTNSLKAERHKNRAFDLWSVLLRPKVLSSA
jgi:hypothetical protein